MSIIAQAAALARPILRFPVMLRTRRNHALEHATAHMLAKKISGLKLGGISHPFGFYLLGNMDETGVRDAAHEALGRLRAGESQYAVHPNCGTNLVTTAYLSSAAAVIGLSGTRNRMERISRFSFVTTLIVFAMMLGQPLGMSIQKHFSTEGDPGDLLIESVTRQTWRTPMGEIEVFDVRTRGGSA